jgi:hypothetical protein
MEDQSHLPGLKKLNLLAALTLMRGVKISTEGISLVREYNQVSIDKLAAHKYCTYFGYAQKSPLCYLYTLAQKAQLALMVDPAFSITAPGLVHLENRLQSFQSLSFDKPFDLLTRVNVPYKDEGSLIPVFTVDFIQEGEKVASCESLYLAKRKRKKKKKTKKSEVQPSIRPDHQEEWALDRSLGKQYARISGDWNPIHTSKVFARISGFSAPILQGWYAVSRITQKIEDVFGKEVTDIDVSFKQPILLPGPQVLEIQSNPEGGFLFQLHNPFRDKLSLLGNAS